MGITVWRGVNDKNKWRLSILILVQSYNSLMMSESLQMTFDLHHAIKPPTTTVGPDRLGALGIKKQHGIPPQ